MKPKTGHYEREAWIMALTLGLIVVIGVAAGTVVQFLGRLPHH